MEGLDRDYWVPEHVRAWLRGLELSLPLEDMEPHIRAWDEWMRTLGDFYDYKDADGVGRVYEVHRRSIHPAMRVCREWGSLLLNDKTQVSCDDKAQLHLRGAGGEIFSPGEASARGSLATGPSRPGSSPLEDGGAEGTYRIVTACFDRDGNQVEPEGVCPVYETGSTWPTFSLVSQIAERSLDSQLQRNMLR